MSFLFPGGKPESGIRGSVQRAPTSSPVWRTLYDTGYRLPCIGKGEMMVCDLG